MTTLIYLTFLILEPQTSQFVAPKSSDALKIAQNGHAGERPKVLEPIHPNMRTIDVPIVQLGKEIETHIRDSFFDQKISERWLQKNAGFAANISTRDIFNSQTKKRLRELGTSHTAYFTPDDFEYYHMLAVFQQIHAPKGVSAYSIGVDFALEAEGWFARRVFSGSAAEQAGLQRGDRILTLGGKRFEGVKSFRGLAEGALVELEVQQSRGAKPVTMKVKVSFVDPKQEWLTEIERGSKLLPVGDRKVGYLPVFSGAGREVEDAVRDVMSQKLAQADALIVDFRDGYGGCGTTFVDLFHVQTPVLSQRGRGGQELKLDLHWRKPLVLLINGGSRSGKEMVAYSLKKHKRAHLIGERTAGAVVAGKAILLSDRSFLYLAAMDVRIDGERLEGKGVEPDIVVPDSFPFANGKDPQFEAALKFAAGK